VKIRIALISLALMGSAQAAGPFGQVVVGNWSGGAYTNDATGQFSHCAVNAGYKNGTRLLTSVTRDFQWLLGIAHPDWNLRTGGSMQLRLVFDRGTSISVTATVRTPKLITIAMPTESALIRAFRQGHYMEVFAGDKRITFALTSTSEMLPVLVNCVRNSANVRGPVTPSQPAAPPVDPGVLAEKKATIEKARSLIQTKMLSCIGREGASMLLTDEKAEAVAKAAMIFCRSDVDALVQANVELIEVESNRPADRNLVRRNAEQRVLELVTAQIIRRRGELLNQRNQPSAPPATPPASSLPPV
jgi:hypothetical protein